MHQKKCVQSKLISLLSPIVLNFTLSIFQAPFLTGLPKHDAARQITNNAYPRNRVRKVNSKPVIFSFNPASDTMVHFVGLPVQTIRNWTQYMDSDDCY